MFLSGIRIHVILERIVIFVVIFPFRKFLVRRFTGSMRATLGQKLINSKSIDDHLVQFVYTQTLLF